MCCALIFDKKNLFSIHIEKLLHFVCYIHIFFRNDFHPTALKNALVKIISFLTRHGLEGNSLEQGEEGAIFSICRPCPPLLVVVTL